MSMLRAAGGEKVLRLFQEILADADDERKRNAIMDSIADIEGRLRAQEPMSKVLGREGRP